MCADHLHRRTSRLFGDVGAIAAGRRRTGNAASEHRHDVQRLVRAEPIVGGDGHAEHNSRQQSEAERRVAERPIYARLGRQFARRRTPTAGHRMCFGGVGGCFGPSGRPDVRTSVRSSVSPSAYPSVRPSVRPFEGSFVESSAVGQFVGRPVRPTVRSSVGPAVSSLVRTCARPSVRLAFVRRPSVCPSVRTSVLRTIGHTRPVTTEDNQRQ